MATTFKFRNLVLGKNYIASRSEFKRLMLTGYMSVICSIISVIYALLDFLNQVYYAFPAYVILFLMPLVSLVLLRKKAYTAAKILLVLSGNLVVFWSATADPFETGAFLFFVPASIGSFAILDVQHTRIGFGLAGFTAILFILAYFGEVKLIHAPRPSDLYIKISFTLNYFISMTVSVLAVSFLMRLNKHSEDDLIRKEIFANEKNRELRKVNEELDRFVYSVSHDLRSPLSSILGLTNLARSAADRAELDQILTMIQGRVHAQDHFIRDIIDYARNARTDVSIETINLKTLAGEVVDSLKFNANASKILFRVIIPEQVIMQGDRIRLTIILSNLIGNAIKYHDFTKEAPFIEIGFQENPKSVYVQDNGIGIMPEYQEKIFDMFYRGSDRSTGSGLGLFITKEAITKLNGRITVKSTYGEGSRFTVYLP